MNANFGALGAGKASEKIAYEPDRTGDMQLIDTNFRAATILAVPISFNTGAFNIDQDVAKNLFPDKRTRYSISDVFRKFLPERPELSKWYEGFKITWRSQLEHWTLDGVEHIRGGQLISCS